MEDESLIWIRDENFAVVGIFDGHSGNGASKHIAKELPGLLASLRPPISAMLLVRTVMRLDDEITAFAGSTVVFVVAERLESSVNVWVVNLGDSRCIAIHPGGSWTPLTMDHKTTVPEEAERAQNVGAVILSNRVVVTVQTGALNLTRSLGDHKFKSALAQPPHRQAISPVPDVFHRVLGLDDILILGSDGLFDGLGSDGVAFFVTSTIEEGGNYMEVMADLAESAMVSKDNVSALMLRFPRGNSMQGSGTDQLAISPMPRGANTIAITAFENNLKRYSVSLESTSAAGRGVELAGRARGLGRMVPLSAVDPPALVIGPVVSRERQMQTNFGVTALHAAVYENDSEAVSRLLSGRADVNAQDDWGVTPLHVAATKGSVRLTKILMSAMGVDVNRQNFLEWTAMCEAKESSCEGVVAILKAAGASTCKHLHNKPHSVAHSVKIPGVLQEMMKGNIPWLERACPRWTPPIPLSNPAGTMTTAETTAAMGSGDRLLLSSFSST